MVFTYVVTPLVNMSYYSHVLNEQAVSTGEYIYLVFAEEIITEKCEK